MFIKSLNNSSNTHIIRLRTIYFQENKLICYSLILQHTQNTLFQILNLFSKVSSLSCSREDSWSNRHRHKLLEQKLTSIRKINLNNLWSFISFLTKVSASITLVFVLIEVSNSNQTTLFANMHSIEI